LCVHEEDDLYHALIRCEHVKLFWYAARNYFGLNLLDLHPITLARDFLDSQHCSFSSVVHLEKLEKLSSWTWRREVPAKESE
jgi:hypothetical protein